MDLSHFAPLFTCEVNEWAWLFHGYVSLYQEAGDIQQEITICRMLHAYYGTLILGRPGRLAIN
jgi:hypothetical protein